MKYEMVIGLEVHTQLKTKSKLFCSCSTEFGKRPNENTCVVCSGQPGALPVLNKRAVELAIRAGLALNCTIAPKSIFSRKNYFYPDLPKGYQISQFDLPTCLNGHIEINYEETGVPKNKKIRIQRAHMEEDAGKLVHAGADGISGATHSYVDLNRSSIPLLEIVTEPDFRTAAEVVAYLTKLKSILQFAEVSDANMEEGKLRCDVNISLRPFGQEKFGTRAEIKNINSFRSVERAIVSEFARQSDLLDQGKEVKQETRNFVDETGSTTPLRSKEDAHDYRYFPEPDLVPLMIDDQWINEVKKDLPELPDQKKSRYVQTLGLSAYDAEVLMLDRDVSLFFDACIKLGADAKKASNWIATDVLGKLKAQNISITQTKLTAENLAKMVKLIDAGTISGKIAKDLLPKMMDSGADVEKLVSEGGMTQISDEGEIEKLIQSVLDKNAGQVEQYKAGKLALFGFFVGQVMKESKGRAKPDSVNQILKKLLG